VCCRLAVLDLAWLGGSAVVFLELAGAPAIGVDCLGRLEERGQVLRQGRSWLLAGVPASIDELLGHARDLPG
jgi:hypothetical protein